MLMRNDDFEWDDAKATINIRDHDVAFEVASEAFFDRNWLDVEDPAPDELRHKRICMRFGVVYAVIYTERDDCIRIISARRATRHEQRQYFEQ